VKEDPGVWTGWIGCILLTVGSFLAFTSSHRRIWLRLEERDGELVATLAGSANKNRATFQRDFEALFQNLKKV
jgi:cytochrome c biogenesis protein ResB